MADLLFGSPHAAAATLERPESSDVTGPNGLPGSRTPVSPSVGTFPSETCVRDADFFFEPVSLASGSFSPVELEEDPGDARGRLLNVTSFSWSRRPRRSSGPPRASASIIDSKHFVCKAASVSRETQVPPGIPKRTATSAEPGRR